jgi:ATP sulfurylase
LTTRLTQSNVREIIIRYIGPPPVITSVEVYACVASIWRLKVYQPDEFATGVLEHDIQQANEGTWEGWQISDPYA